MKDPLPELTELQSILERLERARAPGLGVETLARIEHHGLKVPVLGLRVGSVEPHAPILALTGGVHGIERIGSQVVLAFLRGLAARLEWDETLHHQLARLRLVAVPLVNPLGMLLERRSNGNGVDLMRNSPVEAEGRPSWLVSGHRISPRLPWYRGPAGAPMQAEAQGLFDFIRKETRSAARTLALDVHSGFGLVDRLWFPFAKTKNPYPGLPEVVAFKQRLDQSLPHHVYRVEPQAAQYTTHGDLWDHLWTQHHESNPSGPLLPLTLEIGSWLWVRKNPWQLFSYAGPFNPVKRHRHRRALRRHLPLLDLMTRFTGSQGAWPASSQRAELDHEGRRLWYPGQTLTR